jgi:23S rRNA pseudoU1915 N3-methylase RlmH
MKKQKQQRAAHAYELTAKGMKDLADSTRQQGVIFSALKGKQLTSAQLAKRVEGKLKTKQEPQLVVGFYLTTWKADGLVKFAKAKRAAKVSAVPGTPDVR